MFHALPFYDIFDLSCYAVKRNIVNTGNFSCIHTLALYLRGAIFRILWRFSSKLFEIVELFVFLVLYEEKTRIIFIAVLNLNSLKSPT